MLFDRVVGRFVSRLEMGSAKDTQTTVMLGMSIVILISAKTRELNIMTPSHTTGNREIVPGKL